MLTNFVAVKSVGEMARNPTCVQHNKQTFDEKIKEHYDRMKIINQTFTHSPQNHRRLFLRWQLAETINQSISGHKYIGFDLNCFKVALFLL